MGRRRTIVGTSHSRVIPDESIPDSVKSGLITGLTNSSPDIVSEIVDRLTKDIAIKGERMYRYAASNYHWGLPCASLQVTPAGESQAKAILDGIAGSSVTMDYYFYGAPNLLHIGWISLVSTYGYNSLTNELPALSAIKGYTVYLDDMFVVVPSANVPDYEPGALTQWGPPATAGFTPTRLISGAVGALRKHTPVLKSDSAVEETVRVRYIWQNSVSKEVLTETVDLSVSGYPEADNYFHARYLVGGVAQFWMYKAGAGTYPALDALVLPDFVPSGSYFPFHYFRYNKTPEVVAGTNKAAEPYKSSAKLFNILGMDYDDIVEKVHDTSDRDPAELNDVEQAMMIWAVPALSTNQVDMRYLFQFFTNLHANSPERYTDTSEQALVGRDRYGTLHEQLSLVLQDTRFKMSVSCNGIFKRTFTGSIGAVGTYASEKTTVPIKQYYEMWNESGSYETVSTRQANLHKFRKQVTTNTYVEISVMDLETKYFIFGEYAATQDDVDDVLLIPLDHDITKTYTLPVREELYARSLQFVFNSLQIIKLKWYQTGIFKAFMVILTIVVCIFFPPAALGMIEGLATAIAVGSAAAALIYLEMLVLYIIQGLVLQAAFSFVVAKISPEIAAVLAITLAVYSMSGKDFSNLSKWIPDAKTAMDASLGLIKAANDHVQDLFKDLQNEWDSFLKWKDEKEDELTDARRLLDSRNWMEPFMFIGESPTNFYNRTIHSGNLGASSIKESIAGYVDNALALPTIDQTLGANP